MLRSPARNRTTSGPWPGGLTYHVDDADRTGELEPLFRFRRLGNQAGEQDDGIHGPAKAAAQSLERWPGGEVDVDADPQRAFIVGVGETRHGRHGEQAAVPLDTEADFGSCPGPNLLADVGGEWDVYTVDPRMTSPIRRPAISAGLPGSTPVTSTPSRSAIRAAPAKSKGR